MHIREIHDLMHTMATARPVFHSEADFQHAFAWELQRRHPDAALRLERPVHLDQPKAHDIHLDLTMELAGSTTAVELKYATRRFSDHDGGESYELREHGARDLRRYDVIKDIERVESVVGAHIAGDGFAILLTNDAGYWQEPIRPATADASFRLHEGRRITGEMAWPDFVSPGTTKGREASLAVHHVYAAHWQDYVHRDGATGLFRYLVFEVRASSQ